MKNTLLTLFCICITIHLCHAQDYKSTANQLLEEAVTTGSVVGLSGGFSIDGEVKWLGSAGLSNSADGTEFTPNTSSRIASISKPITAVAILQLYEAKKIDLDLPIQTYLSNFPIKKEGAITIRELLYHTSGIDEYKNNKERENQVHYENLTEAMKIFEDRDLIATPGQTFNYTTYGYVVLGRIIEAVSGMPYADYIQSNILDPLQMENTGVEIFGTTYEGKSMLYHNNSKGKISEADHHDLSNRVPGGGFYSTAEDMLTFGDAIIANSLINEATTEMMFVDSGRKKQGNGYAMGWYLYGENPSYGPVYGHNGAQTGASAFLMLLPQVETSIVVLSNTSGAMQEVTNITIKLFDVAASCRNEE